MLKFILISIAALCLMAASAVAAFSADECQSVISLERHAVEELHIAKSAVFRIEGREESLKYLSAIGAPPPPADSDPKGLFIVEGPQIAYVGIIEPTDCIHYAMGVPISVHAQALALVMKGA